MPKSLAVGHRKIAVLSTKPTNMAAATLAQITAGIDAACALTAASRLAATASDTVDDPSACEVISEKVFTTANAEASLTVFRYFNAQGQSEATADALFQALKVRGSRVWIVERFTSKLSTEAWEAGDPYSIFEFVADNWSPAEATGYIKAVVPGQVASYELNGTVAA